MIEDVPYRGCYSKYPLPLGLLYFTFDRVMCASSQPSPGTQKAMSKLRRGSRVTRTRPAEENGDSGDDLDRQQKMEVRHRIMFFLVITLTYSDIVFLS